MPEKIRLALVQPDTVWEDPPANLKKAGDLIAPAAAGGARVAVLPEMFTTGFSMKAHGIEGAEACDEVASMARDNSVAVLAGVAASSGDMGLNKAIAFKSTGRLIAEYEKMHPFSFAGEHEHYLPGRVPVTFELGGVRSSVFICYDLRFPEVFRSVARESAVIYVIANWPAARREHWHVLLRARAIENQCFVVGVNRVGRDGNGIEYAGGSSVYGPFGQEVFVAGEEEGAFEVEIDTGQVESIRGKYPFLRDMKGN